MTTLRSICVLLFVLSQGLAQGAPDSAPVDPNIRPAGDVILKFEETIEIPEIERFAKDGVLDLFPSDTVHLEFQTEAGNLVNPKVVAEVKYPERTITFTMTQDEAVTMLTRKTAIPATVAMDCLHRELGSDDFSATNLIPTEKGLASFDSWPNSVWMLRLSNIEVTSRPAAEVYEEKASENSPSD